MSKHLNEIITRLGYSESSCLKYRSNNYDFPNLTAHATKILNVLLPFAAYLVNDEPFVLFFDEASNQNEQVELTKKIWNAQIPIVVFCNTTTVKIFNGCTIYKDTLKLFEAEKIDFNTIDENSPFSFWEITNQNFWENYTSQFSGKNLNDVLLDNLTFLTERLKNVHKITCATKLVLRLIFIRYLIDRGVDLDYSGFSNNILASQKNLLTLLDDWSKLNNLFAHLKGKFNGNLFDIDDEVPDNLSKTALEEIKDFLSANIHSRVGQLSLFNLYDFNIIPVELISNIYEILLGKEQQSKDNAFYTPQYLVDYILDMTIDKHLEKNENCRMLDPSCGSGVFLVDGYRRMIEKKLNGELYTDDDEFLCKTLTDNIYGVDLNKDAIDVAIFSLYLAVLDYKNPKTLRHFLLPNLRNTNLFECDFFDEIKLVSLQDISFDFIIGNPPWGSKPGKHVEFCIKHGYKQYLQNNDTCRSFILRSKDLCIRNKNTKCCFVLHSKLLYLQKQPSKKFREFLLTNIKITRIVELSAVRKLVFKNADAPAIVLLYNFSDGNAMENRFEHISMKKNAFFRLFNIIVVEKTDVKNVQQKLLYENDWIWKVLVYGLTGDIDILMRLKTKYSTLKENIRQQCPKIICATGVQYNDGNLKDASYLLGRQLLDSKNAINHFTLNLNLSPFTKPRIHRPRNAILFEAPYCLTMRGPDMKDYTMKAVYSETDFVFHEAVWAIKGSSNQKDFLQNTVGLLNSKLYSYFNLMLGSSIGIEREQRQAEEVLSFPYVFDKNIAEQVAIIQNIKNQQSISILNTDASLEINLLNQTIIKTFGLSQNEFLDYALTIQIPQLTEVDDRNVFRDANIQDFENYGKYFYNYLSEVFASAEKYIQIIIYPNVAKHYSAFEVVVIDKKPLCWIKFIENNSDNQKRMLSKLSAHKTNELFYAIKEVLYFEENSFYIIKPSHYKNWHPAIARLDLSEVTDQILFKKNGGEK